MATSTVNASRRALTIKERQALLLGNKANEGDTPEPKSPIKSTPGSSTEVKPSMKSTPGSSAEVKPSVKPAPGSNAELKPPVKPVPGSSTELKPPVKPISGSSTELKPPFKSTAASNTDSKAVKPVPTNKPAGALKPLPVKPMGFKSETASKLSQANSGVSPKSDTEEKVSQFPKSHPNSNSISSESSVEQPEVHSAESTGWKPLGRPLSIRERMAALSVAAGVDEKVEKSTDDEITSPKPNSPSSVQLKSPVPVKLNSSSNRPPEDTKHSAYAPPPRPPKTGLLQDNDKPKDAKFVDKSHENKSKQNLGSRPKSSEVFLRHTDQKRFKKVNLSLEKTNLSAPVKPSKLENIILTELIKEYTAAIEKLAKDIANSTVEEFCVEAESTTVAELRSPVKHSGAVRVSRIPEYTEEEEDMDTYDDCTSTTVSKSHDPEENYDDCTEGPQEVYEPVDEESEPSHGAKASVANNEKLKKEKEKDKVGKKKEKEEFNKKDEKDQKKKEDERKLKQKFGLTDKDEKMGDGVVLKDATGNWLLFNTLSVKQGEVVAILRMNGNPQGKWLVQNGQGKIGYVHANNIEVATPMIRHVMLKYVMGVNRTSIIPEDSVLVENNQFTVWFVKSVYPVCLFPFLKFG